MLLHYSQPRWSHFENGATCEKPLSVFQKRKKIDIVEKIF